MDVNFYLAQQFGAQPCWELVALVMDAECGGLDVGYKTINRSIREMSAAFRLAIYKSPHGFAQVDAPVDLCIVLLGRTEALGVHHCGIYYQGRVLHAMPSTTLYEELSVIRDAFEVVQFWNKA